VAARYGERQLVQRAMKTAVEFTGRRVQSSKWGDSGDDGTGKKRRSSISAKGDACASAPDDPLSETSSGGQAGRLKLEALECQRKSRNVEPSPARSCRARLWRARWMAV